MKNKDLIHSHSIDEIMHKNYSLVRNKELEESERVYDLRRMLSIANASTHN